MWTQQSEMTKTTLSPSSSLTLSPKVSIEPYEDLLATAAVAFIPSIAGILVLLSFFLCVLRRRRMKPWKERKKRRWEREEEQGEEITI